MPVLRWTPYSGCLTPCFVLDLVTFGSIDDNSATVTLSPANVPPIKTKGVKSFGSIPALNGGGKPLPSFGNQQTGPSSLKQSTSTSNPSTSAIISPTTTKSVVPSLSRSEISASNPDVSAPSTTHTPKPTKVDIRKLFRNPPSSPSVTLQTNSNPSSPALSASLSASTSTTLSTSNTTTQSDPPPSQNLQNKVSTFNPMAGFSAHMPHSPAFPRQTSLVNGTSGDVAPPGHYGYYVSGVFPTTLHSERLIFISFHLPVSLLYATRPGLHVLSPVDATDPTPSTHPASCFPFTHPLTPEPQ